MIKLYSWLADEEWLADFQSSVVSLCCHGDKEDVDVRRRILEGQKGYYRIDVL